MPASADGRRAPASLTSPAGSASAAASQNQPGGLSV